MTAVVTHKQERRANIASEKQRVENELGRIFNLVCCNQIIIVYGYTTSEVNRRDRRTIRS